MKLEWLERIYRLFGPDNGCCPVCERQLRNGSAALPVSIRHETPRTILSSLCGECAGRIPWIDEAACLVCGRPERCGDCLRRTNRHFRCCREAVRYDPAMRHWLAQYKYRGLERLEPVLAAMLAMPAERMIGRLAFDAVTAVPLAEERLLERGFNQAERLAARICDWYRVPYVPLLRRIRHTSKMSFIGRGGRLENMKGSFAVDISLSGFQGREPERVLLVDDIYTTGSTMNECAYVIRRSFPACEVYGVLLARS